VLAQNPSCRLLEAWESCMTLSWTVTPVYKAAWIRVKGTNKLSNGSTMWPMHRGALLWVYSFPPTQEATKLFKFSTGAPCAVSLHWDHCTELTVYSNSLDCLLRERWAFRRRDV
jgi:hypothetical protein